MTDELAQWRTEGDTKEMDLVEAAKEVFADVMPEEMEAEERGLITVQQPQGHHLITGMAALARMDESEFQAAMNAIERGQKRMAEFQKRAMIEGEDYGKVKGIDRPFLHLPGAEKMTLLYGLACRQEAERIIGPQERIITESGAVVERYAAPPLTYHVKTYVHVGSFDGPIVAMGYGEASSWEVKYRYMWAKPACPNCGREGLVKRKSPPNLVGKWNCPSWKDMGGCNAIFEAGDPRIAGGKIENTDPWSLAETLLQMAAKRSFVAATRRATGTSGLFTQDEDSPNVQAQADHAPDASDDVAISAAPSDMTTSRGGKADQPTAIQISLLSKISKERNLGPLVIAEEIRKLGGKIDLPEGTRGEQGQALLAWINQHLTADELGSLLFLLDTPIIEATPGEPQQDS